MGNLNQGSSSTYNASQFAATGTQDIVQNQLTNLLHETASGAEQQSTNNIINSNLNQVGSGVTSQTISKNQQGSNSDYHEFINCS